MFITALEIYNLVADQEEEINRISSSKRHIQKQNSHTRKDSLYQQHKNLISNNDSKNVNNREKHDIIYNIFNILSNDSPDSKIIEKLNEILNYINNINASQSQSMLENINFSIEEIKQIKRLIENREIKEKIIKQSSSKVYENICTGLDLKIAYLKSKQPSLLQKILSFAHTYRLEIFFILFLTFATISVLLLFLGPGGLLTGIGIVAAMNKVFFTIIPSFITENITVTPLTISIITNISITIIAAVSYIFCLFSIDIPTLTTEVNVSTEKINSSTTKKSFTEERSALHDGFDRSTINYDSPELIFPQQPIKEEETTQTTESKCKTSEFTKTEESQTSYNKKLSKGKKFSQPLLWNCTKRSSSTAKKTNQSEKKETNSSTLSVWNNAKELGQTLGEKAATHTKEWQQYLKSYF